METGQITLIGLLVKMVKKKDLDSAQIQNPNMKEMIVKENTLLFKIAILHMMVRRYLFIIRYDFYFLITK